MKIFLYLFFCLNFYCFNSIEAVNLSASKNVKVVIFVPETHADVIRQTVGKLGAGKIGNYDFCSFSMKGIAQFRPLKGARSDTAEPLKENGKIQTATEEKIEFICPIEILQDLMVAVKKVHPYEEMGYDIYPMLDFHFD